jgi:hypothetical protein
MSEWLIAGQQRPRPRPPSTEMPAEVAAVLAEAAPEVLDRLVLAGHRTAEAELQQAFPAGRLGDVVWLAPTDTRPLTLINNRTGASWERDPTGRWQPGTGPAAERLVDRIGVLLASPQDCTDAIVDLLRQDLRRPAELMVEAQQAAARARRGIDLARAHVVRTRALGILAETDRLPHQVVLVVDDVDAYAGSWHADGHTATGPYWQRYCWAMGKQAQESGAGEFPLAEDQPDRMAALLTVAEFRVTSARPGSTWRVRPTPEAAR